MTTKRTDRFAGEGKHPRHYDKDAKQVYRVVRTSKHRYVFFCTYDKRLKREWADALNYPVLPYPKTENQNYKLGEFYKPQLVKVGEVNGS